jgi:hypothetical protein
LQGENSPQTTKGDPSGPPFVYSLYSKTPY